jgi:hypothetical protein
MCGSARLRSAAKTRSTRLRARPIPLSLRSAINRAALLAGESYEVEFKARLLDRVAEALERALTNDKLERIVEQAINER